jgi:hypothetical protein
MIAIPPITRSPLETSRVRRSSSPSANAIIDAALEQHIESYQNAPRHVLTERIMDLEREWSIERWLETSASTLALTGMALAMTGRRKGLWLSTTVLSFLLMHGATGWCPPLPMLRRAGIRTRGEIDIEKFALKYLRGDFERLTAASREGRLTPHLLLEVLRELD